MKRKKHKGVPFLKVFIPDWIAPIETIVAPTQLLPQRMRLILHNFYLCQVKALMQKNDEESPWRQYGYFPVHHAILVDVATNKYHAYIKVLEDAGIIERRLNTVGGKNYLPGVRSQLYRFMTPVHMALPRFRIEKLTDYRCITSALRTRDRYAMGEYNDSKNMILNDTHLRLKDFVEKSTIDLEVVASIMKQAGVDPDTDDYSHLYLHYLQSVNEGSISWFTVDAFAGRVHTQYTNLKSEYRKAIRFRGYEDQVLVNIDLKNSQPYFSAAIGSGTLLERMLPEFAALKPLVAPLITQPDFELYLDLCISGLIYEHIAIQMGNRRREEVKKQFFRAVLFSKKRVLGDDKGMVEVFKRDFPSVYRFFSSIKKLTEMDLPDLESIIKERRGKYSRTNRADKILSCCLQRVEARLITQFVADRLLLAGISPFLTIHDSYLVLPDQTDRAVKIIMDSFSEFKVPPPIISVKRLD